jgi:hypothetical protein
MQVSWAILKGFITTKQLSAQFLDLGDGYELRAFDGVFELSCSLTKDGGSDVVDFESNFKVKGNARLDQRDSDGAPLSRIKAAPTGWSYQLRGLEVTTALVGGALVNRDQNNNQLGDITVACFDVNGAIVTDAGMNATIMKTQIDFEPLYDYYLVSGSARPLNTPTTNVYLSVVGVPDYPPAYGGSKSFIQNVNFRYITTEKINADGRAAKALLYNNPGPHTNKLRLIFYHDAGVQMTCCFWMELYKI